MEGEFFTSHDIEDDGRVQITGTSAHQKTFERSKSHRRINRDAAVNGGYRGTIAKMAGDNFQFFDRFVEHFGGPMSHIEM